MTDDLDPQPTLFDAYNGGAPAFVPVSVSATIGNDFVTFHTANPWVYRSLVKLARDYTRTGRRRIGIGMLFEVLRWQWTRATVDPASEFRLNNNYRSRYARLIMDSEPDLAGVFETRTLTAA